MVRTQPKGRVVATTGEMRVGWPPIAVPEKMTVAIDGLDRPLLLDFEWSSPDWGMVLVGMRAEPARRHRPVGLPTRITRSIAPRQLVAEVLRSVGRRLELHNPEGKTNYDLNAGERPDFRDAGPITRGEAEAFARGRDKSQQAVEVMRKRAKAVYKQVRSERDDWPDVYAEVAERLHVGRTTAYTYLRDAGVIGKGKRR